MEDEKMGGEVVNSGRADYLGKARGNPWMVSTLVLAVALILVLIFNFRGDGLTGGTVSSANAGQNLVDFISAQGAEAEIVSAERDGSLYKVMVNVDGQTLPVYVTVDGRYAIAQPIPLVDTDDSDTQPTQPSGGAKVDVEVGDSPVIGDENAPVTVIEFTDFSCPYCAAASGDNEELISYMKKSNPSWEPIVTNLMKDYVETGKVRFAVKYTPGHSGGRPAQIVSWCLNEQNPELYWKFYPKAFENQDDVEDSAKMIALAKTISGVNAAELQSCVDSGKFDDKFSAEQAEGVAAGVQGTPAFFVGTPEDGYVLISGAVPYSQFKVEVEKALAG